MSSHTSEQRGNTDNDFDGVTEGGIEKTSDRLSEACGHLFSRVTKQLLIVMIIMEGGADRRNYTQEMIWAP